MLKPMFRLAMVIVCGLLFSAGAVTAQQISPEAKEPRNIQKVIRLIPTGVDAEATGVVKVVSSVRKEGEPKQGFQLIGVNLKKGTTYFLVVDGTQITSRAADTRAGEKEAVIEFEFATKGKDKGKEGGKNSGGGLPSTLDPVTKIKTVEIRDSNNQVVLSGEFSQ